MAMLSTQEQLISAINSGVIFMGKFKYKEQITLISRYTKYGDCWLIAPYNIGPAPWQGSDLIWIISNSFEESKET